MSSEDQMKMPDFHKKVDGNKADCPYFQIKNSVDQKESNKNKEEAKNDSDSDEEPRGGCPFMNSPKKRNPELTHLTENFE